MSAPALTAEGLHTFYGKSHILQDVGLQVAEGKITALLGRNGAGKTTTLRSLMGLTPPRAGRITIFGTETTHWPPFRIAAAGVGYVPEGRRIFPNLSVDENLKVPLERAGAWLHRSMRFLARNLLVSGTLDVETLRQSTLAMPRTGEGMLQMLDHGSLF